MVIERVLMKNYAHVPFSIITSIYFLIRKIMSVQIYDGYATIKSWYSLSNLRQSVINPFASSYLLNVITDKY